MSSSRQIAEGAARAMRDEASSLLARANAMSERYRSGGGATETAAMNAGDRPTEKLYSSLPLRGCLIVFEGLNGTGKTTQQLLLCQDIPETVSMSFPSKVTSSDENDDPIAAQIEAYLQERPDSISSNEATYLFSFDRANKQIDIYDHLLRGRTVVVSRYVDSGRVYACCREYWTAFTNTDAYLVHATLNVLLQRVHQRHASDDDDAVCETRLDRVLRIVDEMTHTLALTDCTAELFDRIRAAIRSAEYSSAGTDRAITNQLDRMLGEAIEGCEQYHAKYRMAAMEQLLSGQHRYCALDARLIAPDLTIYLKGSGRRDAHNQKADRHETMQFQEELKIWFDDYMYAKRARHNNYHIVDANKSIDEISRDIRLRIQHDNGTFYFGSWPGSVPLKTRKPLSKTTRC